MKIVVPERIRDLVREGQLTREGREVLEEWLEDCDDEDFDEYLRLRGGEDEEEELVPEEEM